MVNEDKQGMLEERYYQQRRMFDELEVEIEDDYRRFSKRIEELMDIVYQSYHQIEAPTERDYFISQLQDSQDQYYREYRGQIDEVDERRYQAQRDFYQSMDELDK